MGESKEFRAFNELLKKVLRQGAVDTKKPKKRKPKKTPASDRVSREKD